MDDEDDVHAGHCLRYGAEPSTKSIERLPVDVVNRIAAGEIIHRPSNALKEMMENSLDAGSSMIRVQLRDGGLKLLQIQDDGQGVELKDMPLLCERFATSKLRSFSDLSNMTTFGFRGEALASISYVSASMTVISRTEASEMAYKASYASGALASPKPGQSIEPKPCAGSRGTFITAEDLFYNVPQRRRALKSASEEYSLCLDVMSKYAVHFGSRGVGFSCKKANSGSMDLSVPSDPSLSAQDVIGVIYGTKVSKELIPLDPLRNDEFGLSATGCVSGPNGGNIKRHMFLLFINNRLVDCPALRRAILALYSAILPKGMQPWIYLSLGIAESNVDVNVHPTKREVHFLHEEDIVEVLCAYIQDVLTNVSASRSFNTTQSVLRPLENTSTQTYAPGMESAPAEGSVSQRSGYPQHTVRVDAKARTLDSMGVVSIGRGKERVDAGNETMKDDGKSLDEDDLMDASESDVSEENDILGDPESPHSTAAIWIPESNTTLESIFFLRQKVQAELHPELEDILRNQTFVGIADSSKSLLLLQHSTKLYLAHYDDVIEQLSYQLLLRQFGQLGRMTLHPAPKLADLVRAALEAESKDSHERRLALDISEEMVVRRVSDVLCSHAEMLSEYFEIGIDTGSGMEQLTSLPNLFNGRRRIGSNWSTDTSTMVQLERIPKFILRLATQVDYAEESLCFEGILRELSLLHVPLHGASVASAEGRSTVAETAKRDWTNFWQPAMQYFAPPKRLAKEGVVSSVASLPSLYSVFERC